MPSHDKSTVTAHHALAIILTHTAVAFMSTFYNAEAAASVVMSAISTRLSCTVATVSESSRQVGLAAIRGAQPSPTPPPTLWAYNYGGADGWYIATCPSYQCDAVAAAGGALITPAVAGSGSYGAYTDAQMEVIASRAAIWLYSSDNWASDMAPALVTVAAGGSSSVGSVLAASPAVVARAVYDFTLRGVNSWFEDRPAQPDLLVQDLADIISPNAALIAGAFKAGTTTPAKHTRYWWRNVFTETVLAPVTTCASLEAAAALASDLCPVRGSPTKLPSRTPAATRSSSGTPRPTRSSSATRSTSRSPAATRTPSHTSSRTPSVTRTNSGSAKARTATHSA